MRCVIARGQIDIKLKYIAALLGVQYRPMARRCRFIAHCIARLFMIIAQVDHSPHIDQALRRH